MSHVLEVENSKIDGRCHYSGKYNGGRPELTNDSGEHNDVVDNDQFSGLVYGGSDMWVIPGSVEWFEIDGTATVYVDGEIVHPSEVRAATSGGSDGDVSDDSMASDGQRGPLGHNYVEGDSPLQQSIMTAHDDSGDGPGHERRSVLRPTSNKTREPGHTVHVPRGMTLDLRGVTIAPTESYDLFTLDYGSRIEGGMVNLREFGGTDCYDAAVVTFDPGRMDKAGAGGDRNGGYVDENAWRPRGDGPDNKFRGDEVRRQNLQHTGVAVRDLHVEALPRDDSVMFRFAQGASDDAWREDAIGNLEVQGTGMNVGYPYVCSSTGETGYINGITVRGVYAGYRDFASFAGDSIARKHRFYCQTQPRGNMSKRLLNVTGAKTGNIIVRGDMWDPQDYSEDPIRVLDGEGDILVENTTGNTNFAVEGQTDGVEVRGPF